MELLHFVRLIQYNFLCCNAPIPSLNIIKLIEKFTLDYSVRNLSQPNLKEKSLL